MKENVSHPMWVRGLKLLYRLCFAPQRWSHPMWVRGLKLQYYIDKEKGIMSHPMWVRGLKLYQGCVGTIGIVCRTPCGCVD